MLAYAHDTQHEKIIRGMAVGLALIQYGREVSPGQGQAAEWLAQQHLLRSAAARCLPRRPQGLALPLPEQRPAHPKCSQWPESERHGCL